MRLVLSFSTILVFLCRFGDAKTITDFFSEVNRTLTKISWAHAVNCKKHLEKALKSDVMMLEADVSYGQIKSIGKFLPIMAHPPALTSDISLEEFLTITYNFNMNLKNRKKGVKLDFKSTKAWEESINIILKFYNQIDYPFWLYAHIIRGPSKGNSMVDAHEFLSRAKIFNNSLTVVSPGWTSYLDLFTSYTESQIWKMIEVIRYENVTQDISFGVNARIASRSRQVLLILKHEIPNCTLTIWSRPTVLVKIKKLKQLIADFGHDRVYIDVPQKLKNCLIS